MSLLSGKARRLLKLAVASAMIMLLSVSAVVSSSSAIDDTRLATLGPTIGEVGDAGVLPAGAGTLVYVPLTFEVTSITQTETFDLYLWRIRFELYFESEYFDFVGISHNEPVYTDFMTYVSDPAGDEANPYWYYPPPDEPWPGIASIDSSATVEYNYSNGSLNTFYTDVLGGIGNPLTPIYMVFQTTANAVPDAEYNLACRIYVYEYPQISRDYEYSGVFKGSYDITYASNAPTGSVPPSDTYLEGSDVTLPGNTNGLAVDGYIFYGWTDQVPSSGNDWYFDTNGEAGGTALASPYTMPGGNVTLYAVWYLAPADPTPVPDGGAPQTGDNNNIALLFGGLGFGIVLLALLFVWRKRHSDGSSSVS